LPSTRRGRSSRKRVRQWRQKMAASRFELQTCKRSVSCPNSQHPRTIQPPRIGDNPHAAQIGTRPKNGLDGIFADDCRTIHEQRAGHSGLTKTVAAPESRLDDSARFWTAAALCRFFTGRRATQSGRGLPQSTTLTRDSFARNRLGNHRIFETALSSISRQSAISCRRWRHVFPSTPVRVFAKRVPMKRLLIPLAAEQATTFARQRTPEGKAWVK
jgi:hypothetical protein